MATLDDRVGGRRLETATHTSSSLAVAVALVAPLALAAAVAAGGSLFFPTLLTGEPVTVGNLRGTAVVVLAVGLPALVAGAALARRGSVRGLVLWLGAASYLTYQGVMFCFGTPINHLFLAYVALLGLGAWSVAALVAVTREQRVTHAVGAHTPWRFAGGVLAVVSALNALVWLAQVLPVTRTGEPPEALVASGLLTSPVWVQDLALWIPAALVVGVCTWRRMPRAAVLAGALLAFDVLECLSVASDQWWGVRADDTHPAVASMAAVPAGLLLAVLVAVPLVRVLRALAGPD